MPTPTQALALNVGLDPGLAAPPRKGAGGPVDQKAVMTTPTTSAWAAIASMVLDTVSNMRIW